MRQPMRSITFYLVSSILFMVVMLAGFTLFYWRVEPGLGLMDAFYFTVITTRTIGFGDIYPTTTAGKVGTILNALVPATIFMGISLVVLETAFRNLEQYWKSWRMHRHINHTIIIANHELLPSIVAECRTDRRPFVVVDKLPFQELPEKVAGLLRENDYVQGDPTEDHVLKRARLGAAHSIIIATYDDTTNLFVLVSTKAINPNAKTIVRINHEETAAKFKAVGADYLLPTGSILGRMLSQAAVNPISHDFLVKLHTHTQDPFIAETPVLQAFPRAVAVYRQPDYLCEIEQETLRAGDIVLVVSLQFSKAALTSRAGSAK